ncbi:hypothetical protein DES52_101488 [Deinococcus yavapaiensis KR-236]|uniref:Uncharacterized protein n=1 Tax=Deinococcus yavapaiensis KR-236 TaxID=694435 RepID=A0A318SDF8_9DEIO|nr:hypothetical protein DES52_101488 [Deinococcus yavapaiensis KR-236]
MTSIPALPYGVTNKKARRASPTPLAFARLAAFPGTRVLAWVVDECPYCGARHFHSTGGAKEDPKDRLVEVKAPCQEAGEYVLAEPPKQRKGNRQAKRKQERRQAKSTPLDDDDDW